MGNEQSTEEYFEFKDVFTNYVFEKKYTDSRFGEVKLMSEKKTQQKIFQKDYSCNDKKTYNEFITSCRKKNNLNHPNLVKLFGFNARREDMLCGDYFKISIFFESFDHDLEQEISRRAQTKDYFLEVELWYIFDSIVSAGAYLQENQISHGDIRPYNVFVSPNKEYKVCDTSFFKTSYNPTYFGLIDGLEEKTHYPSPQVFKELKSETKGGNQNFNKFKNDVFGLGMTMLHACHLESLEGAYDWTKYAVDPAKIEEMLAELRDRYTDTLIQTLRFTLSFSESDRPDFSTLENELGPYRADIRARVSHVHRATVNSAAPERQTIENNQPGGSEWDQRVKQALKQSEDNIVKNSPSRYSNKNLDPYIQSYLNDQPPPNPEKTIIQSISPHLALENKYQLSLAQYPNEQEPNYRQSEYSEPLRRSQLGASEQQNNYYDPNRIPERDPSQSYQPQNYYSNLTYQPQTQSYQGSISGQNNQNAYQTQTNAQYQQYTFQNNTETTTKTYDNAFLNEILEKYKIPQTSNYNSQEPNPAEKQQSADFGRSYSGNPYVSQNEQISTQKNYSDLSREIEERLQKSKNYS